MFISSKYIIGLQLYSILSLSNSLGETEKLQAKPWRIVSCFWQKHFERIEKEMICRIESTQWRPLLEIQPPSVYSAEVANCVNVSHFSRTKESLANRCEPPYGSEGSLVPVRCIQKNLFWNLLGLTWWSQLFSVLRSYLGHSPVHGFTDSSRKLKSFILGRTHKSDVL